MNIGLFMNSNMMKFYFEKNRISHGARGEFIAIWYLLDVLIDMNHTLYILTPDGMYNHDEGFRDAYNRRFYIDSKKVSEKFWVNRDKFKIYTKNISSDVYTELDYIITDIRSSDNLFDDEVFLFNNPKNGVIAFQYEMESVMKDWSRVENKKILLFDYTSKVNEELYFSKLEGLSEFDIYKFYPPYEKFINREWNPCHSNILIQFDRVIRSVFESIPFNANRMGGVVSLEKMIILLKMISDEFPTVNIDLIRTTRLFSLAQYVEFGNPEYYCNKNNIGLFEMFKELYSNYNLRVMHYMPHQFYLRYLSRSIIYMDLYSEEYTNLPKSVMEALSIGVPTVCRYYKNMGDKTSLMANGILPNGSILPDTDLNYEYNLQTLCNYRYEISVNECFQECCFIIDSVLSGNYQKTFNKYNSIISDNYSVANVYQTIDSLLYN
tara:strand:+ start:14991 stop:16298 length:1308 start_codon:yes stop_codon:yes gene_type:complete